MSRECRFDIGDRMFVLDENRITYQDHEVNKIVETTRGIILYHDEMSFDDCDSYLGQDAAKALAAMVKDRHKRELIQLEKVSKLINDRHEELEKQREVDEA